MKRPSLLAGLLLALSATAIFAGSDTTGQVIMRAGAPLLLAICVRFSVQAAATAALALPLRGRAMFHTEKLGLQLARGLVDWQQVAARLERSARDLRLALGRDGVATRMGWTGEAPETADPGEWLRALEAVAEACAQAVDALDTVSEIAPDFVRLQERAASLGQRAQRFAAPCEPGSVRWVDAGLQMRLVESPLDIRDVLAEEIEERLAQAYPEGAAAPTAQGVNAFTSWYAGCFHLRLEADSHLTGSRQVRLKAGNPVGQRRPPLRRHRLRRRRKQCHAPRSASRPAMRPGRGPTCASRPPSPPIRACWRGR